MGPAVEPPLVACVANTTVAPQRRAWAGRGAPPRRREAQVSGPRAQRASLSDSARLSERSARRARSEFRDGATRPSIAGQSAPAPTAAVKRLRLPGHAFAAPLDTRIADRALQPRGICRPSPRLLLALARANAKSMKRRARCGCGRVGPCHRTAGGPSPRLSPARGERELADERRLVRRRSPPSGAAWRRSRPGSETAAVPACPGWRGGAGSRPGSARARPG